MFIIKAYMRTKAGSVRKITSSLYTQSANPKEIIPHIRRRVYLERRGTEKPYVLRPAGGEITRCSLAPTRIRELFHGLVNFALRDYNIIVDGTAGLGLNGWDEDTPLEVRTGNVVLYL